MALYQSLHSNVLGPWVLLSESDVIPGSPPPPEHIEVDLGPHAMVFCKLEVGMIPRILIGVLLGGAAGFGLSCLTRGIGSS